MITYKTMPWFPGYRFTSDGRVQSRKLMGRNRGLGRVWRDLTPVMGCRSRYVLTLINRDGKPETHPLHWYICSAFHGERPENKWCEPIDGNLNNCHADNLRWNGAYSDRHGEKNYNSIISDKVIREVRRRHREGETGYRIAKDTGIAVAYVYRIIKGEVRKEAV